MSDPPRLTVEGVSAPYANVLRPVPRLAPGVCAICRSGARPGFDRCWKCGQEALAVGAATVDAVGFVALAPAEGGQRQLAHELFAYKHTGATTRLGTRLGAVLWRWRMRHESCLARAAGVGDFDVVTTVPSSTGRSAPHPLERVVGGVVHGSDSTYYPLLRTSAVGIDRREFRADRFAASDCAGLRVLLIDDTWTTGAKMLAAGAALKKAGAAAVGGLAIGRWYHPGDPLNAAVESVRARDTWSWEECMFCRP